MPNIINQVLLDRYRVDAFLASGGMGAVYRVWDLERNVPLAMKVLHAELAEDPQMFRRFEREANALKKLSHPNIVPFYGLFRSGRLVFLLERYIDGPSLKEILQDREGKPVPVQEALIYLKALTSALGYAHSKGVVHCDVKPGNILLDQGGNIFLADFGIARHAESTTTTMVGAGTVAYMAPEQILERSLTPSTDVYALGIMLFEMLTGQRPFRGNEEGTEGTGQAANERIRVAHIRLPPPDPRSINSNIPATLANVILLSLDKRPEYRYRTATEFFTAICEAVGSSPNSISDRAAHLEGIVSPGQGPSGRYGTARRIIPLVAGVTLTGFLAVAIAAFLAMRPPPITPTPQLTLTAIQKLTQEWTPPRPTATVTETPTRPPIATSIPTTIVVKGAEMVLIPSGDFTMGGTIDQATAECRKLFGGSAASNCQDSFFADESPPHAVNLDAYYIDKFEVTNALYRACVNDGGCTKPFELSSRTHPQYYGMAEYDQYPVIWVDRNMAQSYCSWRGGRLPTEAEWEKAARGKTERIYPWGNLFDDTKANSCDINCPRTDIANRNFNDGYADVAPVNAFSDGVSVYDVFNMSGNVSEWVSDLYDASSYSSASGSNNTYVIRGGSWMRYPINLRVTTRSDQPADHNADDLGFRCVLSIP